MDRQPRALKADSSSGDGSSSAPRQAGFSFEEAQVSCAKAGGRLCTEVEWERACKGPRSTVYAGGDEPCDQASCSSGYDVEGLGAALEWTASTFSSASPFQGKRVLRGSPKGASPSERRCAGRRPEGADRKPADREQAEREPAEREREAADRDREPADREAMARDLTQREAAAVTFRCCYGAPNAERLRDPTEGVPFREVDVPLAELRTLLERDARTKPLTEGLAYFREDAASVVLSRGPGDTMGFTLTTRGVLWAPTRGVELLVLTGRSGEHTAFVVAYFTAGEERVLAGTFIMKNEPGPIALAYAPSILPRIHFTSCFGCPGETGKVLFRPPESVVLLQP